MKTFAIPDNCNFPDVILYAYNFFDIPYKSILCVLLKVYLCRSEILPKIFVLQKNNILKVLHNDTFYFLRYEHPRYIKCLFSNEKNRKC